MMYERTVRAALSETRGKFLLAEALALDVPPRDAGNRLADEGTVVEWLTEAREAIIEAGGEPRSVATLDEYRRTAFWAAKIDLSGDIPRNNDLDFAWVDGASFSAHNEARKTGMTLGELAAMDKRTVDVIRRRAGNAGTDGQPSQIAESWTPDERAEASGVLLNGLTSQQKADLTSRMLGEPEVAQQVVQNADPTVRGNLARAEIQRSQREQDEVRERRRDDEAYQRVDRATRIATLLHELSKANLALATSVTELNQLALEAGEVNEVGSYIERIDVKIDWIKARLAGGTPSLDDELAALLQTGE